VSPASSPLLDTDPIPESAFTPLRFKGDHVSMLDQTRLPVEEVWIDCRTPEDIAGAIRRLSIRGAPAIGVAAAYGLVLSLQDSERDFESDWQLLAATRPTAVNLRWALDQGRALFERWSSDGAELLPRFVDWALRLHRDDVATNRRMGDNGAALFEAGDKVMTHCNAGALATAGYGTAIGVIQSSFELGRVSTVWVDETRPLLQGARLTAWELKRLGIPHRLVTDSSAGALISRGHVDRIVVGADRIAANGDVANKIGTYVLAVLAQRHGVPFYVAAPLSTIDRQCPSGADIPIEERSPDEITQVFGTVIAPEATEAMNYAFDVTPAELVSAIITEVGVLEAPYPATIAQAFEKV
jgi:methylthioribose-1-phosphate isomerase